MNKIQVDAEWLEQVTIDVSEVTAAVRDIADQARAMKALLDDAKYRERAVREVHKQTYVNWGDCEEHVCDGNPCSDSWLICGRCLDSYPCDTIKALDGDTDTLERDDDHDSRRDDYLDEDLG